MISTQRITNAYGIRDQHLLATSGAGRDFSQEARQLNRITYRERLVSVVNTGDETVFVFTAEALRPAHYYWRLWRDHIEHTKAQAARTKACKTNSWRHADGSIAADHVANRGPWYARVSNNASRPIHVAART